jgi:DNA polymerase III delta prime subunit
MPEEPRVSQEAHGSYIAQATGEATATVTVYTTAPPLSVSEQQRKRNRATMLDLVQSIWIKGVLEPSLYGVAQITLELQHKPSAVIPPLGVVQREFQQTGPLPTQTSIQQVYEQANSKLLILGEPGSGKTTLLLELTRDLLERARQNEGDPMPVVFPLSSWATKRLPLSEWLAEELNAKYQLPPPLACSWILTDQVLPLLDGLDEVAAPHRAACVEAINAYLRTHGLLPTVVCCRQADYLALSPPMMLSTAVVVQPLTQEQIETYLISAGEPLATLRQVRQEDTDLQTLASTPLMLTILMQAYRGTPLDGIAPLGTLPDKQRQVFEAYVKRMLTRRGPLKAGTDQQVAHWLSFLATQMRAHNQTVFYLEHLQSDWLPENRLRRLHRVGVEVLSGLIGMLLFGLVFGLFGRYTAVGGESGAFVSWLTFGLSFGLFLGSASWPIYLTSSVWTASRLADFLNLSQLHIRTYSAKFLLDGLVGGLLGGLGLGLAFGQVGGLEFGLSCGLFYLLWYLWLSVSGGGSRLSRLLYQRWTEIKTVEVMNWSWASMRRNVWKGVTFSAIFGLFFGLGFTWANGDWSDALIFGWLAALAGAAPMVLASGWSREILSEHRRLKPNQGIWLSARNGVLTGLANGLCLGLVVGLVVGQFASLVWALLVGLTTGVGIGLIFGLASGGFACIQQAILRLLLQRAGVVPHHYVRFLDEAAGCILLRNVGGGYSFVHRLLLDYFAGLEKKDRK